MKAIQRISSLYSPPVGTHAQVRLGAALQLHRRCQTTAGRANVLRGHWLPAGGQAATTKPRRSAGAGQALGGGGWVVGAQRAARV